MNSKKYYVGAVMSIDFVENYKTASDEEIVALVREGKVELLEVIFSRYLPRIYFIVGRYCSETEVEDAVQEVIFNLYSAIMRYNSEISSFSTYAYHCAKNTALNIARRREREKAIPDKLLSPIDDFELPDENSPEKIFFDKENYNNLKKNIKLELSALELNVLQLFLSGKKYIEIADELCISEKSVNNALLRIRKKLKSK